MFVILLLTGETSPIFKLRGCEWIEENRKNKRSIPHLIHGDDLVLSVCLSMRGQFNVGGGGSSKHWNVQTNPLSTSGLCSPSASDTNAYYFISDKMSWTKARDYCVTQHTDLAEIDNPDNNTALLNTPNWEYPGDAWIGLRPDVLDWTWVNGELPTYDRWEQYSTDELCVYMTDTGSWKSADCSLKKYGVCNTCGHQRSRLPSDHSVKFQWYQHNSFILHDTTCLFESLARANINKFPVSLLFHHYLIHNNHNNSICL